MLFNNSKVDCNGKIFSRFKMYYMPPRRPVGMGLKILQEFSSCSQNSSQAFKCLVIFSVLITQGNMLVM